MQKGIFKFKGICWKLFAKEKQYEIVDRIYGPIMPEMKYCKGIPDIHIYLYNNVYKNSGIRQNKNDFPHLFF